MKHKDRRSGETIWPRRTWLTTQALTMAALATQAPWSPRRSLAPGHWSSRRRGQESDAGTTACSITAAQSERLDPVPWQVLAQQAVDAARAAGARYADARLTRDVLHRYGIGGDKKMHGEFQASQELVGVGVRALVDGYWGFSASTIVAPDEAVRLARDAVGQATENAKGPPRVVDLGRVPVATGTWVTPLRIDPFTISIEEKLDNILYWVQCLEEAGIKLVKDGYPSWLRFARQERVVATSEGALFTQTLFESGGIVYCSINNTQRGGEAALSPHGIDVAGAGWERLVDAMIPDQYGQLKHDLEQRLEIARTAKPSTVGRYTVVYDGATMASLVERTLGIATQLDRALGYEANAGGTSFIDDPLSMVGTLTVASPVVTVTGDRSAPAGLATVKWDEEGVEPAPFTLVKDGVLTDFQTTREQAAWLAPYYQRTNQPSTSHGCAAAENAHRIPIQMMPNLALEPSPSAIQLEDLVADVKEGLLIEDGTAESDFQARTGLLRPGRMREIKNGKLGRQINGGAVLYTTQDLWKHILAVGGPSTQSVIATSQYIELLGLGRAESQQQHELFGKGQPPQVTSHSVRAVAATIPNQPVIDPTRKA